MIEFVASHPLFRLLFLLVVLLIVAGLAAVFVYGISSRNAVRRQLKAISSGASDGDPVRSLHARNDDAWTRIVDRIEKAGLSLTDTKSDALRERMTSAGFISPAAPRIFTLTRLVLVIVAPCLFVALSLLGGHHLSFMRLYIFGSLAALAGLYLPTLVVRARTDRRREAIVNGFPDSLDLMLVCVEAGLGLEAALDRVGREMALSRPLVANLLTTATLQLRAGASREVALRRMSNSAHIDEIRSFSTLLIQSDKLGTSIATTLRIYAAEMREKRRMRAEEKAHRIPVLISIPLVACMLPVMIGVLMLPAAVQVVRHLIPALQGTH